MKLKLREGKNPRTGKPITIISDIIHNPGVIDDLASELKSQCGAGGFVEGKKIIIQGSHIQKVQTLLEKKGYQINT